MSSAPITAEGKVLVANGAGDGGTRGWLAALDARTGNEVWRWYAVPKPGEPGSDTWKDKNNAWKTGGGGLWQTGSYDPSAHLTMWGTGNPIPQYHPPARPRRHPSTNPPPPPPLHPRKPRPATTSTPTRSSPLMSTPASSRGISNTRQTTPGITTRSASTCCTTRPSTASSERSSATSPGTVSTTLWIARPASSSRAVS